MLRSERLARDVLAARERIIKQQDKVRAKRRALPIRVFTPGTLVFAYIQDTDVNCRKLQSPWAGPFYVMKRQPGDHPPLIRVMVNRQDTVDGIAIHQDRLKVFIPDPHRYFIDPVPGVFDTWHELEDGALPDISKFALTEADLDTITEICGNTQPLVPTQIGKAERSDHCTMCREKVLLVAIKEKKASRIDCSFCNGFIHSVCLFKGKARSAANIPKVYRCPLCVRELPKALRAAKVIVMDRVKAIESAVTAVRLHTFDEDVFSPL